MVNGGKTVIQLQCLPTAWSILLVVMSRHFDALACTTVRSPERRQWHYNTGSPAALLHGLTVMYHQYYCAIVFFDMRSLSPSTPLVPVTPKPPKKYPSAHSQTHKPRSYSVGEFVRIPWVCLSNAPRSLGEVGTDTWVVNETDASRHIQYPPRLTHFVPSMKNNHQTDIKTWCNQKRASAVSPLGEPRKQNDTDGKDDKTPAKWSNTKKVEQL